ASGRTEPVSWRAIPTAGKSRSVRSSQGRELSLSVVMVSPSVTNQQRERKPMERSQLFMFKSALTSTIAIPALMLSFASVVEAGPNEGGVILLHRNPDVVYTSGVDYCGQSDLLSCSDAVTRADVDDTVVLHVLASFLSGTEPRMAGVCFGVEYDESSVAIDDWGYCGDFELHQTAWPSSGSGICVTWFEAQTAFLTEIGWLAAHSVDGSPAQLSLVNHPVGGGVF